MIDQLREIAFAIDAIDRWDLLWVWLSTVTAYLLLMCACAWFDHMPRLVYRLLYQPLEICVVAGPTGLCAALAYHFEDTPFGTPLFILAVLSFFGGILVMERWLDDFFACARNLLKRDNSASDSADSQKKVR